MPSKKDPKMQPEDISPEQGTEPLFLPVHVRHSQFLALSSGRTKTIIELL